MIPRSTSEQQQEIRQNLTINHFLSVSSNVMSCEAEMYPPLSSIYLVRLTSNNDKSSILECCAVNHFNLPLDTEGTQKELLMTPSRS